MSLKKLITLLNKPQPEFYSRFEEAIRIGNILKDKRMFRRSDGWAIRRKACHVACFVAMVMKDLGSKNETYPIFEIQKWMRLAGRPNYLIDNRTIISTLQFFVRLGVFFMKQKANCKGGISQEKQRVYGLNCDSEYLLDMLGAF